MPGIKQVSTFSSATGLDLGFKDENTILNIELSGDFFGLFGSGGNITLLDEDTKSSHDVFTLILVEIKESLDVEGKAFIEGWLE
jgi:hypothetical protein